MSERWGDSARDRQALDNWITDEDRYSSGRFDEDNDPVFEEVEPGACDEYLPAGTIEFCLRCGAARQQHARRNWIRKLVAKMFGF